MSDDLLKQILEEMKSLNQRLSHVESNMATKQDLMDIRVQMNSRFDTLETKMSYVESDVASIKATVDLIASETPQDVMGMLKQINAKLEEKNYDVQALNKRLFKVESVVERVTTEEQ